MVRGVKFGPDLDDPTVATMLQRTGLFLSEAKLVRVLRRHVQAPMEVLTKKRQAGIWGI
jgi:hypothetical protein